jgi:hypothetical protein
MAKSGSNWQIQIQPPSCFRTAVLCILLHLLAREEAKTPRLRKRTIRRKRKRSNSESSQAKPRSYGPIFHLKWRFFFIKKQKENENTKTIQHATCNTHAQPQPNGTVRSLLKSALTSTMQVKIVKGVS